MNHVLKLNVISENVNPAIERYLFSVVLDPTLVVLHDS